MTRGRDAGLVNAAAATRTSSSPPLSTAKEHPAHGTHPDPATPARPSSRPSRPESFGRRERVHRGSGRAYRLCQRQSDGDTAPATAAGGGQWDETFAFWQKVAPFAADHGIERIALGLHPLHMAYNVPILLRLRDAVGPTIGANVDPSHMFWQRMDAAAVVRALGPAVHHVHLKDVEYRAEQLALAGVLDNRPFTTPAERAWTFRTVGHGHGAEFWAPFIDALAEVGYDDVVSIENEDPVQDAVEGVTDAARFIKPLLR